MKDNIVVKEPEEMLKMKGDFSESALKLSAYLISQLKENEVIYKINIKDYFEKFDKKIGNYDYLYKITKELSQKQFEIKDRFNEKFSIFNFISSADYADGVLEIEFSYKLLKYLLEIKNKYLQYNIQNIMSLSSKYVIRLYKVFKDELEKNNRYDKKTILKLSIDEIKEILEVPRSYKWQDVKRRIIDKAQKNLQEHTDIKFEYRVSKKIGRKIVELEFKIMLNDDNIEEEQKIIEEVVKRKEKQITFSEFRKQLLAENTEKVIIYEDNEFILKNNLLWLGNNILSKEEALAVWSILYDNRDKIIIKDLEEYKKEQEEKKVKAEELRIKKLLLELIEKYKNLLINDREAELQNIERKSDKYTIYYKYLDTPEKIFATDFEKLDDVEYFLRMRNEDYEISKRRVSPERVAEIFAKLKTKIKKI